MNARPRRRLRQYVDNQPTMTRQLVVADAILSSFSPDGEPVLHKDAALVICEGLVEKIGPASQMRRAHPEATVYGGAGRVVVPGFINAHHHVGLTPFQLGAADRPLELWFVERMGLPAVDPRLDTLYSAFEMIASGVTTVQHLDARAPGGPGVILARARAILGSYADIGMRVSYSFALRDQNRLAYKADQEFIDSLPHHMQQPVGDFLTAFALPLEDQIAIFHALRAEWRGHDRVAIQIGPSNLHWLSEAALESAARMSDETGAPMHMHLLETPYQAEYARRRAGCSPVVHLERQGLLNSRLTIGHGVWMTDDDIKMCAQHNVRLCHNCSSNLRLGSGKADVPAWVAAGLTVALGIDEAGMNDDRDMLQEMRLVHTVHRGSGFDRPGVSADAVLRMATEGGAATTPFAGTIGRLTAGSAADLVILDWERMTFPYQSQERPLTEIVLRRATPRAVETVMIGGRLVLDRGRFLTVDREETLSAIEQALRGSDNPPGPLRALARSVMPHAKAVYEGWY